MRSPRPFRHAFPDSRLLADFQFDVRHHLAKKFLIATYQLLSQEEEEGLRQCVCQDLLSPLQHILEEEFNL